VEECSGSSAGQALTETHESIARRKCVALPTAGVDSFRGGVLTDMMLALACLLQRQMARIEWSEEVDPVTIGLII